MKQASGQTHYQERATEFAVGDYVVPFGHGLDVVGTIVALYPAIGMADVQTAWGATRYPVEDLQRTNPDIWLAPPKTNSVPGGAGTVPAKKAAASPERVALYWKTKDRQYHATKSECDSGVYGCPRCKEGGLKKAIYKRREGASEHLYACPNCMFLIKNLDIHMHGGE